MSDRTCIEWTDATWNPIRGCSRVSPGCVHCYAEGVAKRFSGPGQPYEGLISKHGAWNGNIRFIEHALDQPLRWKRPRRIFVNSMSDLFHENVSDLQITRIFDVMEQAYWHTFQVLTKRPERMRDFVQRREANHQEYARKFDNCPTEAMRSSPAASDARRRAAAPPSNIWLGVSVENQEAADERIPLLLQIPAAIRFLSCEPLLGPIDLDGLWGYAGSALSVDLAHWPIHWVIAGGESGRGARPMDANWARGLRDQCNLADVAFFFKQWGEYLPAGQDGNPDIEPWEINASDEPAKVGKKRAGRRLDGRIWNEFPKETQ